MPATDWRAAMQSTEMANSQAQRKGRVAPVHRNLDGSGPGFYWHCPHNVYGAPPREKRAYL